MRNDYRGEAIPLKITAPIAVSRPVSSRPRADAAPLRLPMPGETIMPDHRKERALDAAQTDRFIAQGFIHIDYAQEPFRRAAAPIRRSCRAFDQLVGQGRWLLLPKGEFSFAGVSRVERAITQALA